MSLNPFTEQVPLTTTPMRYRDLNVPPIHKFKTFTGGVTMMKPRALFAKSPI